jgi:hypothetical protein
MKFQLVIDVRMLQQGNYNNGLHLGDSYSLELNTLSDAAEILVKFHELANALLAKKISSEK